MISVWIARIVSTVALSTAFSIISLFLAMRSNLLSPKPLGPKLETERGVRRAPSDDLSPSNGPDCVTLVAEGPRAMVFAPPDRPASNPRRSPKYQDRARVISPAIFPVMALAENEPAIRFLCGRIVRRDFGSRTAVCFYKFQGCGKRRSWLAFSEFTESNENEGRDAAPERSLRLDFESVTDKRKPTSATPASFGSIIFHAVYYWLRARRWCSDPTRPQFARPCARRGIWRSCPALDHAVLVAGCRSRPRLACSRTK
jgi:hypothetical protein